MCKSQQQKFWQSLQFCLPKYFLHLCVKIVVNKIQGFFFFEHTKFYVIKTLEDTFKKTVNYICECVNINFKVNINAIMKPNFS